MAIQIRDEAGLLTPSDIASLQAASGRWPFDVHIITSTPSANKAALENRVSAAVDGSNVIAIGVDPTHHMTIVHYGKEAGIPRSQWDAINAAGNSEFKGAHWSEGLMRIADRAVTAKQQATAVTLEPNKAPGTDHTWLWVSGGVVLGLALIVGIYYWTKARRQAAERQRQLDLDNELLVEKSARNREERDWTDKFRERTKARDSAPVYRTPSLEELDPQPKKTSPLKTPAPTPTTSAPRPLIWGEPPQPAPRRGYRGEGSYTQPTSQVHHHHHNSGGSSNDMLVGYALGRMDSSHVDHVVIHEEPVRHHYTSSSSSYDDGGSSSSFGSSSSSYDDGGSSSSWSSDSGGSSSSYDSGSSDSGGGSSDW